MRKLLLPVAVAALMSLSGCAGWVVFGHTIQGPQPATAAQPPPTTQVPTPQPTPAQAPVATQPLAAQPAPPASPETPILKAVTLTFTPAAQQKIAAEPQFQQATLLTAIESELRAHKLLDTNDPHARGTAEISIDDFTTRPTSNAVVFGYILGTGTLSGNVAVHAVAGNTLRDARITAQSHLAKPVSDGQANPFDPLFHRFATATVDSLTGTTSTQPEPHWGQDRPPP
jgi:hypothetical protein